QSHPAEPSCVQLPDESTDQTSIPVVFRPINSAEPSPLMSAARIVAYKGAVFQPFASVQLPPLAASCVHWPFAKLQTSIPFGPRPRSSVTPSPFTSAARIVE